MKRAGIIVAVLVALGCAGQRAERLYQEGKAKLSSNRREAIRLIAEASRTQPDNPKYHHGLGAVLANSGMLEQAKAELETAVRLDPTNIEARRVLESVTNNISTQQAADIAVQLDALH